MPKITMELTQEEADEINAARELRREELASRSNVINLLDLVAQYAKWLDDEGAGSTYSTFCDDFGYRSSHARKKIYEEIQKIIELARASAREIGDEVNPK